MSRDGAGRTISEELMRSFPAVLARDERLEALGRALAQALGRLAGEAERTSIYPDIGSLDERLLDILAYDFKVDWWDGRYSLEEKRRTLAESWKVHRSMGTKAAVEAAIRAVYPRIQVLEWFEYGGEPYRFKLWIDFTGEVWSEERPRRVLERVMYYKSLRSWLERLEYVIRPEAPETVRIGGLMGSVVRLAVPELRDELHFEHGMRVGGAVGARTALPVPEMKEGTV